jgi:hypothetical protein
MRQTLRLDIPFVGHSTRKTKCYGLNLDSILRHFLPSNHVQLSLYCFNDIPMYKPLCCEKTISQIAAN